ncbi:unnamed protein product [Rotaria sp. Silwood1]|nr:unnamed protein product [Rotaria sp. Silwood1]CAF1627467.1 unnamed protein product [Rotaria sp. Silwood1]
MVHTGNAAAVAQLAARATCTSGDGQIIYAGSLPRTKIIKTFRPSENEFKRLYDKFSNTLKCPCSQVAIQYSYFTNIDVKFHEVCESQFITQDWIDSVYHVNVSIIPPNDVRTVMSNFWQFIRSFCNLTKETFTDAYTDFNATILLTPVTQSQFFIETNVEASLNFSVTSAVSNLKRNLFISRETTLVNGFMSSLATNYHMESVYYASLPNTANFQSRAKIFEDKCVCSNLRGCPRPVSIFDLNTKSIETNVTGMIFDCLLVDGVLASSLDCFYQSSCLSLLQNEAIIPIGVQPLNASSRFTQTTTIEQLLNAYAQAGIFNKFDGILNDRNISSRFPMNRDFGTMLNELLIEDWISNVSYNNYFDKCAPLSCSFTIEQKFDWFYVFANILGLYGGLSVGLKLILPVIVSLILLTLRQISNRFRIRPDCQLAQTNENVKSNSE